MPAPQQARAAAACSWDTGSLLSLSAMFAFSLKLWSSAEGKAQSARLEEG